MRFNTYEGKLKPTTITEYTKLSNNPNAYGGGKGFQNLGNVISGIGANEHKKLKEKLDKLAAEKVAQNNFMQKPPKNSDTESESSYQLLPERPADPNREINPDYFIRKGPHIPVENENTDWVEILNKRFEEQTAANIIFKTNEFQDLINTNLTLPEDSIHFEETKFKLDELSTQYQSTQELLQQDPKALNAYEALSLPVLINAEENYKNTLSQKFMEQEEQNKINTFKTSVQLAIQAIEPTNLESVVNAIAETTKQTVAMFGISKTPEELEQINKEKNKTILGTTIGNLITDDKTDNAFDLYTLATQSGLLSQEDLSLEYEEISNKKRTDMYEQVFEKYLDDGEPEDVLDWFRNQELNIAIGQGESALKLETDQEDIDDALSFIGDKKIFRQITKFQEREANKKQFQENIETLITEGKYDYTKGLELANSIAKNEEEYNILKKETEEINSAFTSKTNAEIANKPPKEALIDIVGKIISGKDVDKDLLAIGMLTPDEQKQGLMAELRGMVKSVGTVAGNGILNYEWQDKKGSIKDTISKFDLFKDEHFEEIYGKATNKVAKLYIERALKGEKITETEIDELLGSAVVEGMLARKVQEEETEIYTEPTFGEFIDNLESSGIKFRSIMTDGSYELTVDADGKPISTLIPKEDFELLYEIMKQEDTVGELPKIVMNMDGVTSVLHFEDGVTKELNEEETGKLRNVYRGMKKENIISTEEFIRSGSVRSNYERTADSYSSDVMTQIALETDEKYGGNSGTYINDPKTKAKFNKYEDEFRKYENDYGGGDIGTFSSESLRKTFTGAKHSAFKMSIFEILYESDDYPNSDVYLELVEELKCLTVFGKKHNMDLALEFSDPTTAKIALDVALTIGLPRVGKWMSLGIDLYNSKNFSKYEVGQRIFEYSEYRNVDGERPPYSKIKQLAQAEVDFGGMVNFAKGALGNVNPTSEMIRNFIEANYKLAKIFEVFGVGAEGILDNVAEENFSELLRNTSREKLKADGYM
ncbi:hypothetical protein LJC10_05780 [Selenomonadales bacterium OttesenSCG-928-I06]|nr:hypothetical protein [Selenomonadales bacterium OttesenSCG-928-I06]